MAAVLEGTTVGRRYEIQGHLAAGGMALVYRGWDHRLNRPVAIKMLRQFEDLRPRDVQRFRREARTAAMLHCPQIVEVYDFFEEEDGSYLVMELVEGVNLKERLARSGPLPPAEALGIAAEVCEALDCAHARGFVHRDIKPQNILLAKTGEVKLTDFGIVHVADATHFTTTGMVLGTADYISPEQAQGLDLTPATDLYSLGVVLFEMLTAALPFTGTSVIAVAMQHATKVPPSLRALNPAVPHRVERLVRRALAKRPEQRFRAAREMAHALRHEAESLQRQTVLMAAAIQSGAAHTDDATMRRPVRGLHRFSCWRPAPRATEAGIGGVMEMTSEDRGDFASERETVLAADVATPFAQFGRWGGGAQDDSLPPEIVQAYLPQRDEEQTVAVPLLSPRMLMLLALILLMIALFLPRVL
jgi:serine/threonine-protein kinase